jgi:hypothetical protein
MAEEVFTVLLDESMVEGHLSVLFLLEQPF